MPSVEVLARPPVSIFKQLNAIYQYDSAEIKYIHSKLLVTIKQDTYMQTVEAMVRDGVISRGHKAVLIRLTQ
jgi:hypothetical protein